MVTRDDHRVFTREETKLMILSLFYIHVNKTNIDIYIRVLIVDNK